MPFRTVFAAVAVLAALSAAAQSADSGSARQPGSRWSRGRIGSPDYFPLAVWLQDPAKASAYRAAGFNLYVGLWQGPTREKLTQLAAAGMPVVVTQDARSLAFKEDPTIVGWMHNDEPDNAQEVTDPATGRKSYGPCIPPASIVRDYAQMRAADPTRPILLNLGQGVANDGWIGRGAGASLDDYRSYVRGADVVSFDVYPVADDLKPGGGDNLGYLSKGLDRMAQWTGGAKILWNCIECTRIGGGKKATPQQVRAETWLSLVHGSRGLIYFVHQFKPTFDEHALLDDPEMLASVTVNNRQIRALARVLNSPPVEGMARVESADGGSSPIDLIVKRSGRELYLFAVNAHPCAVTAKFTFAKLSGRKSMQVVDEARTVAMRDGRVTDRFEPYAVHIYRAAPQ